MVQASKYPNIPGGLAAIADLLWEKGADEDYKEYVLCDRV